MTSRMISDGDLCASQFLRLGNCGFFGHHDSRFADAVSPAPHDPFLNLRRLVDRPMASAAHIAGTLTLASVPFGITLERAKPVIDQRSRRIDSVQARRVLAAAL